MNEDQRPPLTLEDLLNTGKWQELPSALDTRIVIHPWPDDSVDTVVVRSTGEALGERTNSAGQPVWRHFAAASVVIVLVWNLPPPGALGAPNEVLRSEATDQEV